MFIAWGCCLFLRSLGARPTRAFKKLVGSINMSPLRGEDICVVYPSSLLPRLDCRALADARATAPG